MQGVLICIVTIHHLSVSVRVWYWTYNIIGHCNACHKKWGFTDNELCDCGEIQTMSHIVNSCPLTKFDGGLLRLHEADEAAVDWLTTYGSQHTIIIIIGPVSLNLGQGLKTIEY